MARADSAKFSAIFTEVETLHKLGTDAHSRACGGALFKFCSAIFRLLA
jgi:hypothetical protein